MSFCVKGGKRQDADSVPVLRFIRAGLSTHQHLCLLSTELIQKSGEMVGVYSNWQSAKGRSLCRFFYSLSSKTGCTSSFDTRSQSPSRHIQYCSRYPTLRLMNERLIFFLLLLASLFFFAPFRGFSFEKSPLATVVLYSVCMYLVGFNLFAFIFGSCILLAPTTDSRAYLRSWARRTWRRWPT